MKFNILLVLVISFWNSASGQVYFENQATALGAGATYDGAILGAGITFYDYNQDGLDDITLASPTDGDHIFLKNEGGVFVEDDLGISSAGLRAKQTNWVDYDNDGDLDFFVTSDAGKCSLYRNDDDIYTDVSTTSGIPQGVYDFFGASWGDIDNDGFLDFFLSVRDPIQEDFNMLYKNNGDGTFSDVTEEAGLDLVGFLSFCSAFLDYDNDGYQDIYIANDKFFTPNLLYRNNGDGTFEEVGETSGAGLYMGAMSTTVDDYNNDGWLDIYVTNFYPPDSDTGVVGNAFLLNNGDGTFTNIAEDNGTRFDSVGWGAVFLDADNDTHKDLYVSGNISDQSDFLEAAFYHNQGDGNFIIPESAGFEGDNGSSFANAIGDVDNDGYPEIVVMNNSFEDIYLWKNETPQDNNWLKIKLEGTESNRMGIGSMIKISAGGQEQYNYTLCGEGFLGQNSAFEFFGIGNEETIDFIEVTWLSGQVDYIDTDIPINVGVTIIEGSNALSLPESSLSKTSLNIFPNPVTSSFNLDINSEIVEVKLFNLKGQLIKDYEIQSSNRQFSTSDFSKGAYFIRVIDVEGNVYNKKLLVN